MQPPQIRRVGIFILFLICLRWSWASDAVVTIVTSLPGGSEGYGTGFVSSTAGDVITCYHVVEGARKIAVSYRHGYYEARVVEIAPDRDVAKLQMIGAPVPTQFFRVRYDLPSNLLDHNLTIEGFALGERDQRITVHATQNGFALSDNLRGVNLERLFRVGGVKLLTFTGEIYKGMSGSPLLTEDGSVIGIVEGSLTQGGSIAWAIAAENTQPQFTQRVVVNPASLNWPPLTLMMSGLNYDRSRYGIGEDLINKLEAGTQAINLIDSSTHTACEQDNVVVAGFSSLLRDIDNHPNLAAMPATVLYQPGEGGDLGASFNRQVGTLVPQQREAVRLAGSVIDIQSDAVQKVHDAWQAAVNFQSNLPQTGKNRLIARRLERQKHAQDVEFATIQRTVTGLKGQWVEPPAAESLKQVSDYRQWTAVTLGNWGISQQYFCSALPSMVEITRNRATDYRLLLSADIIDPSSD